MNLRAFVPGTAAWRRRRHLTLCRRSKARMHEVVDGELHGHTARALERHLESCDRCGAEAGVIRDLKQAVARVGAEADPQSIRRLEDLARRMCERGPEPSA